MENLTSLKILVIFIIGRVCCETVVVKTSANYTFTPKVTGQIESILWKFQNDKVVEYDKGSKPKWYRFEDRGSLNMETGDLTLEGLTEDQSGSYESEIQVAKKEKLEGRKFEVTVVAPVPVPKVTCSVTNNETTLQCSVDPPVQVTFEWSGPDGTKHGPTIHIHQDPRPDSVYFCTAKNTFDHHESAQFALKDCNTGGGSSAGTIVCIVFGVLLGIVLSVAAFFGIREKLRNDHEPVPKS